MKADFHKLRVAKIIAPQERKFNDRLEAKIDKLRMTARAQINEAVIHQQPAFDRQLAAMKREVIVVIQAAMHH